jgi:hypothetical protein
MCSQALRQYQKRDWDVVDYGLYEMAGFPYALRGPPLADPDVPHGVLLGAAQTFGVLVEDPWPHRLSRDTGLPLRNLAVGGAAPILYLNNTIAIDACNAARVCVVQVMSGRGSDNSYFESRDGKNMLRPRGSDLPFVPGDTAFRAMFANESRLVTRLVVSEVRLSWTLEMIRLLNAIRVPKIVLWFSKRAPDLPETITTYEQAAGVFPHFVTRQMIETITPFCDRYVEVVSSRGMPHQLKNRFTGGAATVLLGDAATPRSTDTYYPSPEMHEDVHAALLPVLGDFL